MVEALLFLSIILGLMAVTFYKAGKWLRDFWWVVSIIPILMLIVSLALLSLGLRSDFDNDTGSRDWAGEFAAGLVVLGGFIGIGTSFAVAVVGLGLAYYGNIVVKREEVSDAQNEKGRPRNLKSKKAVKARAK